MEKMQEAKALDHQREIKIAELNAQVAGVNAEVNAAREKHLADQETAKQLNLTTSMQAMHLQVANMKVAALAREMSAALVATAVDVEDIEGQHGATPVEGQHEVVPVDLAPAVEGQHEAVPVVEGQHEVVPVVEGQHDVVQVVKGQHESSAMCNSLLPRLPAPPLTSSPPQSKRSCVQMKSSSPQTIITSSPQSTSHQMRMACSTRSQPAMPSAWSWRRQIFMRPGPLATHRPHNHRHRRTPSLWPKVSTRQPCASQPPTTATRRPRRPLATHRPHSHRHRRTSFL